MNSVIYKSLLLFITAFSLITASYGISYPDDVVLLEWVGSTGYENDGLEPETGSQPTEFIFKVKYKSSNNTAPAWVIVNLDTSRDGFFSENEQFSMKRAKGRNNRKGVIYSFAITLSYHPSKLSYLSYYFTASDGKNQYSTPLGYGPVLKQDLSMKIQPNSWFAGKDLKPASINITDFDQRIIITNTGNGFQKYALSISSEDKWVVDGWVAASNIDSIDENKYLLSAVFTDKYHNELEERDFNEFYDEDVLTLAPKIAEGPVFSLGLDSKGQNVAPEQEIALWFKLVMPTSTIGEHALDLHTIRVKVICLPQMK
ncbi:hypothetical protein JXI42_13750 [bacterium]|nr:hypothetical protein [bacterium]